MSAYVVFLKEEVTDQSELDAYSQKVGSSFKGRDLKFLATYGALETLEGSPIQGAVILEFPDMDAAGMEVPNIRRPPHTDSGARDIAAS